MENNIEKQVYIVLNSGKIIKQLHLKEKLILLNKFNVLLQCKFDIYTAKYISDIVEYNIKLLHKLKYNNVIKELKCRLIFFYYNYNKKKYNNNYQLLYNKINI